MDEGEAGYAVECGIFERAEVARLLDELAKADLPRSKAGARHLLRVPGVRALASDPRVMNIAARFTGGTPVPFRATLFDKSPESNWLVVWHQDTTLPLRERIETVEWGPWSVKGGVLYAHAPAWALERVVALRVHLDDSTDANGPLRLLPCTHLRGVLTDEAIDRLARATPDVPCLGEAGSVIAMRPLIVHASSKAQARSSGRRVIHIEYAPALRVRAGVELAVA
jgi:ectoine hydroxylase-related dioxygenase (phytanoyl-CoA dioxygenase family)